MADYPSVGQMLVVEGNGPRVSPHEFVPLARIDRLGQRGRCRHCYAPRYAHPVPTWDHSRVYGDRWGHRIPWRWSR